jgi:hypothetical protein
MKVEQKWKRFLVAGAALALVTGMVSTPPSTYAGGTIKADEDKWISIGMGMRNSWSTRENGSPDGQSYDQSFNVDNARIYINGQIHKYVKFTFNTECFQCPRGGGMPAGFRQTTGGAGDIFFAGNSTIGILDMIGKFEFNEKFNIWFGRTLVPTERGELNGPFYHATYNGFRTPFYPNDNSFGFNSNLGGAGVYGRDNGAVFFGKLHPMGTHVLWSFMVHQGVTGGPNRGATPAFSGRLQWNLLNDEDNPGYYTSGTYYGTAGDILALAVGFSHQHNGAGSAVAQSDFNGLVFDALLEKLMPNNLGVLTVNGEFKRFWGDPLSSYTANGTTSGIGAGNSCGVCVFNGNSWTIYGLYLLPNKVGIGRFQPYGRFTRVSPINSNQREEWEAGVNYVIDGHNARISLFWTYGDLNSKGFIGPVFGPGIAGNRIDSFNAALQLQY